MSSTSPKRKRREHIKFAPYPEHVGAMFKAAKNMGRDLWFIVVWILANTGLRMSELIGQRAKRVVCRCRQCRAWRLHTQGLDPTAIAPALKLKGFGPRQVEDLLDLARKEGEHRREPLPGLRVKDFDFALKRITVRGKGWASGRHETESHPVDEDTLDVVKRYIESNGLKPEDKLVPLSATHVERIVLKLAVAAKRFIEDRNLELAKRGEPEIRPFTNAELMTPHRLRAYYITEVILAHPVPQMALRAGQEAARHKRIDTTAIYADIRKDELAGTIERTFGRKKPQGVST